MIEKVVTLLTGMKRYGFTLEKEPFCIFDRIEKMYDLKLVYSGKKPKSDEEAFALSIHKWEVIASVLKIMKFVHDENFDKLENSGGNTCGMCMYYYNDSYRHSFITGCHNCPVYQKTWVSGCEKTPFEKFFDLMYDRDIDGCIKAAQEEAQFLKDLWEEVKGIETGY